MPAAPANNPQRRPRADAQRNRAHILDVADRFFSEHGVGGSLDAVAKQAGVGPGTLYRHFPTREALLAALLAAREDDLVARLDAIRAEPDAGAALEQWLQAVTDWTTAFDGLPEPLREAVTGGNSALVMTCQGFIDTTEELLRTAQQQGLARPDIRGRDLFLGVLAMAWVREAALADQTSPSGLSLLLRHGWSVPAT